MLSDRGGGQGKVVGFDLVNMAVERLCPAVDIGTDTPIDVGDDRGGVGATIGDILHAVKPRVEIATAISCYQNMMCPIDHGVVAGRDVTC